MVHRPGGDVTLVGTGLMLSRCLEAAETLAGEGIEARVIEVHTIKPLDGDAILAAAARDRRARHRRGAQHRRRARRRRRRVLAETCPVPVARVGVRDTFATTGPYADLLEHLGLGTKDVVAAAKRALAAKPR